MREEKMQAAIIYFMVALIVIMISGSKLSTHFSGEKSQGETSIQQNNLEKEEGKLSGRWHYSVHQTSGPGNHSYNGIATINQRESSITIIVQGQSISGAIQGNSISVSRSYSNGSASLNGIIINDNYIKFSITVQADGQRWEGIATFTR
jgi:hypothetical protein